MAGKVFISYARPTADRARQVAQSLSSHGFDVWIDDHLLSHRPFADSIEEALTAADAAVVLWSEPAVRSDWVRSEANRAREAGKLIQLRLDGCALPMPFDQIHCIDIADWRGEPDIACWRSALSSLGAAIAARGGPTAPAASRTAAATVSRPATLERRRITVLSCTIADWQTLAAEDPEDLLHVTDDFRAAVTSVIPRHDGTVVEHSDGTALAFFGHAVAGEEDGANAVRAALTLSHALSDHAISVGVATGLVMVKPDAIGAASVVGETPAVARMLAAAAPSGAVLVSETTRRVSAGMFTFGNGASFTGQGAARPVRAFAVVDATGAASRSQVRAGAAVEQLIGRAGELARLTDCWGAAADGMGQVALLTGEAGIGKSTLLDAFRSALPHDHAQLTLHCGPSFTASALHPVSDALRQAAGIERAESATERRAKLDAYAERVGLADAEAIARLAELIGADANAPSAAQTPERRRAQTLDSVLALLDALTRDRPGLFVIEDLHWTDPTTFELITRAIDRALDRRWMILGTARPEFQTDWGDRADIETIALQPLGAAEVREFCRALDPEQRLPDPMLRAIVARGDGNPLFLGEIIRFVLDGIATNAGAAAIAIPDTLHDLLVARLDRLGPAREVARIAAILGRRFSYELIAAVTADRLAPADLRTALRDLAKQGMLEATGTPPRAAYSFHHALFVDAAYESVPKREREALHGRIAAVLREQFADLTTADPALLANHLTRAGQAAEAIPLWAIAGIAAAAKAAHLEAIAAFRTALDLLRKPPRDDAAAATELQLLLGLAVSQAAVLGYSAGEVGETLGEASAICDAIGNVEGLFVVLRNLYAFTLVRGELDAAEDLARRCVEIAGKTELPMHRIEAFASLGHVLWTRGKLIEGRALLEQVLALYQEHDGANLPRLAPMDPFAGALGPLGLAVLALGDMAARDRIAQQLEQCMATASDGYSKAFSAFWRSTLVAPGDDVRPHLQAARRGLAIAEEGGYALVARQLTIALGSLLGAAGDPAAGLALAEPALTDSLAIGLRHGIAWAMGEVATLHGLCDDIEQGLARIDQAVALATEVGELYGMAPLLLRRAWLLTLAGDEGGASAALAASRVVAVEQGADGYLAWIDAQATARVPPLPSNA